VNLIQLAEDGLHCSGFVKTTMKLFNEEICGRAEYFSFIMVLYHRDSFSCIAVDYRNT